MWVFPKNRDTPKWMFFFFENLPDLLMDDLGVPPFWETSMWVLHSCFLFSDFLEIVSAFSTFFLVYIESSFSAKKSLSCIRKKTKQLYCFTGLSQNVQVVELLSVPHYLFHVTPPKFNIPVAPEKCRLEGYFPIGKVTFQRLC